MAVMRNAVVVVLVASVKIATGEPLTDDEMFVVKPSGMAETAVPKGRPSWCPARYTGEVWDKQRVRRAVSSWTHGEYGRWGEAAEHICQWADDPSWQKQATYLVQMWMNSSSVDQAEAEKAIARQIQANHKAQDDENREPTDEERFAWKDSDLTVVKPEPGVDTARITGKPAWCEGVRVAEKWDQGRISRTVQSQYTIAGAQDGALHICQRPDDPTWRTEATYILQQWMNWTGMTQAEAEVALRFRIQRDKIAPQKAELCKALEPHAEAGGQDLAFAKARRALFGCGENGDEPQWANHQTTMDDIVGFYLDDAAQPDSELLRLSWLLSTVPAPATELPAKDANGNRSLLYYAMASYDMEHLDLAALDKELAAAPYNDYARTVARETATMLRLWRRRYEAGIDKLAKDDVYRKILREAPKKGFAEWDKLIAPWKAEIERSNAFERKLAGPSLGALKGCSAELGKDVTKVLRSYKLKDYDALVGKVKTDPIAVLLFSRLAVCEAIDGIHGRSGALQSLLAHGRAYRGPRSLAYYAIVDAIAEASKDRPRLQLSLDAFWNREQSLVEMFSRNSQVEFVGFLPADLKHNAASGVIQSATKVAEGVRVVFKKQTIKFPEVSCVDDVHHPLRIASDGTIEYYRNCKTTGKMETQDQTPSPFIAHGAAAAGLRAGAFVVASFASRQAKGNDSYALPLFVKKSSTDKTIESFLGFPL